MNSQWVRAVVWLFPAAVLGSLGVFVIGFLGCHSGGGFCAVEPTAWTTRWLITGGIAVTISGGLAAAWLPQRRWLIPLGLLFAGIWAITLVGPRLP